MIRLEAKEIELKKLATHHIIVALMLMSMCTVSVAAAGRSIKAQSDVDASASPRVAPVAEEALEDSRFVDYEFNPNQVFDIPVSLNSHLHILLAEGEEARHFSVFDRKGWTWSPDVDTKRSIYIRAKTGARPTSATLRTTHGIYEMTFRVAPKGISYRQVRFTHPSLALEAENNSKLAAARVRAAHEARASAEVPTMKSAEHLNFKYATEGAASFKPTNIYDDGEQTFVVLGSSTDLPVIFETDSDGRAKSVAYTQRNGTLIIKRVMARFVLALGSEKVFVSSMNAEPSKSWRWPWQ